jgi:hypothetical protein
VRYLLVAQFPGQVYKQGSQCSKEGNMFIISSLYRPAPRYSRVALLPEGPCGQMRYLLIFERQWARPPGRFGDKQWLYSGILWEENEEMKQMVLVNEMYNVPQDQLRPVTRISLFAQQSRFAA